jgi:hypothetical protein
VSVVVDTDTCVGANQPLPMDVVGTVFVGSPRSYQLACPVIPLNA